MIIVSLPYLGNGDASQSKGKEIRVTRKLKKISYKRESVRRISNIYILCILYLEEAPFKDSSGLCSEA